MEPAKRKLKLQQGKTLRKPYQWKAGGVPVDLTGWKARLQIRPEVRSEQVLADLTTENGGIIIDPLQGKFTLFMSDADTALLDFETAVFELEMIAPNGDVMTLMYGDVTLRYEAVR